MRRTSVADRLQYEVEEVADRGQVDPRQVARANRRVADPGRDADEYERPVVGVGEEGGAAGVAEVDPAAVAAGALEDVEPLVRDRRDRRLGEPPQRLQAGLARR